MNSTLYDGIIDVLRYTGNKGIINAIATNKPEYLSKKLLKIYNIDQYFCYVAGPDKNETANKKELIERCLKHTGIKPEESLMIGDTTNDSYAAKENHVSFIGAGYGYGSLSGGKVINKPLQLIEIIESYNHTRQII